jgi:hypothetical protein
MTHSDDEGLVLPPKLALLQWSSSLSLNQILQSMKSLKN